jgi:hypothetical protein
MPRSCWSTEERKVLGTTMVVATIPVTDLDRARRFYG